MNLCLLLLYIAIFAVGTATAKKAPEPGHHCGVNAGYNINCPGVGKELSFDYGTAAISYPNGTIIPIAKIEGNKGYKQFMALSPSRLTGGGYVPRFKRRLKPSSIFSSATLHQTITPFIARYILRSPTTSGLDTMLSALKAAVDDVLREEVEYVHLSSPVQFTEAQRDMVWSSLDAVGMGNRRVSGMGLSASFALVGSKFGIGHLDGETFGSGGGWEEYYILVVDFHRGRGGGGGGVTTMSLFEEDFIDCLYLRHDIDLDFSLEEEAVNTTNTNNNPTSSAPQREQQRKDSGNGSGSGNTTTLQQALEETITFANNLWCSPRFKKRQIKYLLLTGDMPAGNPDLVRILEETFGEKMVFDAVHRSSKYGGGGRGMLNPVFAAALGASLGSMDGTDGYWPFGSDYYG